MNYRYFDPLIGHDPRVEAIFWTLIVLIALAVVTTAIAVHRSRRREQVIQREYAPYARLREAVERE